MDGHIGRCCCVTVIQDQITAYQTENAVEGATLEVEKEKRRRLLEREREKWASVILNEKSKRKIAPYVTLPSFHVIFFPIINVIYN